VYVTWFGAWAFAKHYNLRLPTEEEWEKVARGNTGWDHPWGDSIAQGDANYWQSGDAFSEGTTPVGYYNGSLYGSFQTTNHPGPYGAYDMAGNVSEWTESFYGGSNSTYRILRGGWWGGFANSLRSWDRVAAPPTTGYYSLGFRCVRAGLTSGHSHSGDVVKEFYLMQNYPNPFNPATTIRYGLPHKTTVQLTVFNTLGQSVSIFVNGEQEAGYHEVKFDGSHLGSGVYFYRIEAGSFVQTRKLLLIR
jgi:hypothetical protein